MNMLFIKNVVVGFMVSEIPRVSVFGHCPYSVTFPYISNKLINNIKLLFVIIELLKYNFAMR